MKHAALALLLLTVSACTNAPLRPTLKDSAPIAGCSERSAGLPLPAPPKTDDLLDWQEVYIGAVRAYTSVVLLRVNTADCLDAHRKPKGFWQKMFGK